MKKTYNAPKLRVIKLHAVKVFSGSLTEVGVNTTGSVTKGNAWAREDNTSWDIWGSDEE